MESEKIRYVQKYLNIDSGKIEKNYSLINDFLFYKKEIALQRNCSKDDLICNSHGSNIGTDNESAIQTIYDILNCVPVHNFEYPENKKFAVCLTHDIDDIYLPNSHKLLYTLSYIKNLDFNRLKKIWNNRKELSPYLNFKEIMKLEEKYNAVSSFYFISTDKDILRFRYNIEDIKPELGEIVDKGCEVGLHGGYYAYCDLKEIEKEKILLEKALGKNIIGYRNHYLMFKVPDSWKLLAMAGFKYDTTFGYNDMMGFRNGLCHPFEPFDLKLNKEIDILEIPLTIMDIALLGFSKSYDEKWRIAKQLIDTVENYNGVLTLLWHNIAFNCPFRKEWLKLYTKILDYVYEKDAWLTSGENIFKWWRKNGH